VLVRLLTAALLVPTLSTPVSRAPKHAAPAVWTIDKGHSSVNFQVRHFVSKVRGAFADFKGTISADTDSWENAQIDVEISAPSSTTNNDRRDADLRYELYDRMDQMSKMLFTTRGESRVAP
jgi:polyisoprenoid-binding protein YceI